MSETLALLAAHALGDFPLQTDWHAENKFDDARVRLHHAVIHAVLTLGLLVPVVGVRSAAPAAFAVLGFHFVIDTRRWVDAKDGVENYPVWVDQSLHIASLYVVSVVVL